MRSRSSRRAFLSGAAATGGLALGIGAGVGRVRAVDTGVYYVAPWGRDGNDGTIQRPFATLAPVAKGGRLEAPDGATIRFLPGTYDWDDSDPFSRQDGLTFESYLGDVTIDGQSNDGTYLSSGMLQLFRCDDVTVRGLRIARAPGPGVRFVRSERPTVEDVVVHRAGNAGVSYDEVTDGTVRRCEVFGNYSPDAPVDGGAADGISFTGPRRGRSVGGTIEHCQVHHNSDDGIDLFRSRDVTVRHNHVWGSGHDERGVPIGEAAGKGIKLGSPRDRNTGGHLVHNNVVWQNGGAGIGWNGADLPVRLYNNTAFHNEVKTGLKESIDGDDIEFYGAHPDCRIRNNVALAVATTIDAVEPANVGRNTWQYRLDDVDQLGFYDTSTDQAGTPATALFVLPRPDSVLVDAGVDVGLPFAGLAPDVGARESEGQSRDGDPDQDPDPRDDGED